MTLHLKPETEARLEEAAAARGLSPNAYLEALVERELLVAVAEPLPTEATSGMVTEEHGLEVYRTGNPLPQAVIDDTLRRAREDRLAYLLGTLP